MLTKATAKYIKSLQLKKNRVEHQRFLVEGTKSVIELLNSDFEIERIIATPKFLSEYSDLLDTENIDVHEATESQISSISSYSNNNSVVAAAKTKKEGNQVIPTDKIILALDDVRDAGNLGTIIRIADWYGIDTIIASRTTTDFYSPKVISATMGSFTRVSMSYVDLSKELEGYTGNIYGALMDGESVSKVKFAKGGILVMGNESNGISDGIISLITDRITIPRIGQAESLNVAIATAIICDRIKN